MDKNRGFPNIIMISDFEPGCVIYLDIHVDYWWHLIYSKVMILIGNHSILKVILCHFYCQNVHMPFP